MFGNMHSHILLQDAISHCLLRRGVTGEELELCTTLFNQNFKRLDADPALVGIIMCLL